MFDRQFEPGDRVTRPVDVFDKNSATLHGVVTRRYSQHGGFDGVTWYDPELYEVLWDDVGLRKGYFRHGLDPAS